MQMTKETFLKIFSQVGLKEDVEKEYEKLKEYPSQDMVELDVTDLEMILKNLNRSIKK